MQKIHMGAWVSRQFATQDSFGAVVHACMWVANFGYLGTPMDKTVSDLCKFNHSPCDLSEENNPGSQQYSYISGRASPPRMGGRFIMTRTKVRSCSAVFLGVVRCWYW